MLAAVDRQAWDDRYASAELVWSAEPNRFVAAELSELAPGRALDVACGEGRNAIWLASVGHDVTAVDFSGVALAKARELAAKQGVSVRWVEADVVESALPEGPYDLVLLCYLQLPAAARRVVLTKASSALAAGGTVLVIAHDIRNLTEGVGGPQDPAVLCGPEDVAADLDGHGLVVTKAERVTRAVVERPAIDLLVRAERPQAVSDSRS